MKNKIDKYFEDMNDLAFSEFQANILMAELDRLANQKTELRNLIYIYKESLREDPKICINKCLGPMVLIGMILWLLIFSLIDHLI